MTTNSTGMHRKAGNTDQAAMFRHLATGCALFALTVALLATLFATAAPSATGAPTAPAWQAQSAAMLAQDAIHARPYWDGRRPKVWVGQDPMCLARYWARHGWARADKNGPRFRVECEPDGSLYAWNEVS